MKRSILIVFLMAFTTALMAKDIQTVVLTTTPQMHCENCENKIKNNVRFVRGVKSITTSVADQTVTIKYDADKTSVDKIVKGFAKIGYKVRLLKDGEKVTRNADAKCTNM